MALGQFSAVTGRRYRPDYVADINARTPYLPSLYAQRREDEYNDKVYDQKNQQLDQQQGYYDATLGLDRDRLDLSRTNADRDYELGQRKLEQEQAALGLKKDELSIMQEAALAEEAQRKKANRLAMSQMGMQGGLGLLEHGEKLGLKPAPFFNSVGGGLGMSAGDNLPESAYTAAAPGFSPVSPGVHPDSFTRMDAGLGAIEDGAISGLSSGDSWIPSYQELGTGFGNAFSNVGTYSGGLFGASLGPSIGEAIFDTDEEWARIVGGAATGFAGGALFGGDLYSGAIGGLIGGLGGLF